MLVKSTIGILFIIFNISSPLFAEEKSTNAIATEKEENYLIEIDEKGNVKIPEFRNPNVDYTKVEEDKKKKSVFATNNVGSTIPVVQKPPLVIKPIFDKEPIDYSKPPNPDFGMLTAQFLGGLVVAGGGTLVVALLEQVTSEMYKVPISGLGTVTFYPFYVLGVYLGGSLFDCTGDLGATYLWGLAGAGSVIIGVGMSALGMVYVRGAGQVFLMSVGSLIAVVGGIGFPILGFNTTLRYKDEVIKKNRLSVSAYEIEKNGQMVTDLVITANVLSIAF